MRTTQNVVITYELAGLRDRILAFMLDVMLFMTAYGILSATLLAPFFRYIQEDAMAGVFYVLLPIVLFLMYHFFFELFNDGQSVGKRALGIRVVGLDGQVPGLGDHLLRAIFVVVDALFSIGVLGSLLISSSAKNQRLGDMAANTTVIRIRPNYRFSLQDILNISDSVDYEPTYPQVRQLSEADMLLVKNTLARTAKYRNTAHEYALQQLSDHLVELLDITPPPGNEREFLRTLVRDYIVITR